MGISVFFFGGFRATPKDIDAWTGSAGAQRGDVDFNGFPWPAASWNFADDDHAVRAAKGDHTVSKVIKAITALKDDVVYIVGHSSGCAIANAVDEGLSSTGNVNLVSLDGFRPSKTQQQRDSTQMWSARNGDAKSLNFPKHGDLGGRLKVWPAPNCTNIWSLHFAMVNTTTTDATVKTNKDIPNGYQGCRANLCWLAPAP